MNNEDVRKDDGDVEEVSATYDQKNIFLDSIAEVPLKTRESDDEAEEIPGLHTELEDPLARMFRLRKELEEGESLE